MARANTLTISSDWRSLDELERKFTLDREMVIGFASSASYLERSYREILLSAPQDILAGRVVVAGLVSHAQLLLVGGLQALISGNGAVWAACARGLMETLGAFAMIAENPLHAPKFLDHVRAGKLRASAEKSCPGLGRDIDRLSNMVHPGSGAILGSVQVISESEVERNIGFRLGLRPLNNQEGKEGVTVLANLAQFIAEKVNVLVSRPASLETGKVVLRRTSEKSAFEQSVASNRDLLERLAK